MVSDKLPESIEQPLEKFVYDVQLAAHHGGVSIYGVEIVHFAPTISLSINLTKCYPNKRSDERLV